MRRLLAIAALTVLAGCGSHKHSQAATPPACVPPVREPVLPSDMVQDLGTLQVGTDATFTVTTGTSSFFIFSQEVDNSAPGSVVVVENGKSISIPNAVVPTDVRSPTTLYYNDIAPWPTVHLGSPGFDYPDFTRLLAYDMGFTPVSEALPVPNTSAALALQRLDAAGEIEPGTWKFTVNDWARQCPLPGCIDGNTSGRYHVHVVTRPGNVFSTTGTLDLEVYLATDPAGVLSTAAAATAAAANPDSQVARWIQGINHFLGNAGISLGVVTFNDLAPDVKSKYALNGSVDITDAGPCGDLAQLFTAATAVAPSGRAVHLFLAEEIIDSSNPIGGFFTIGVDGSIPGPSGFPGTIYGGAIIGLFDELGVETPAGSCGTGAQLNLYNCGTDRLAYVAVHEIGHWLGLYHTTEYDGYFFDPISDTEPCPCYSCVPSGTEQAKCTEIAGSSATTVVTNAECTRSSSNPPCGGGANLMFWALDDNVSKGDLSADQSQIMRLNPAVR